MTPARKRRWQRPPARGIGAAVEAMAPPAYRIKAMVDGLDEVALTMERKWGVGRLRLLVSDFLRAKFDEQKDRLDAALRAESEAHIAIQVEGMKRAWEALDRAAQDSDAKPLNPQVWECVLPTTGEVVSLVRTPEEAHHVAREESRVFTVAEVALLIEGLGDSVFSVKRHFPGATMTAIRKPAPIDWKRGDDIPF